MNRPGSRWMIRIPGRYRLTRNILEGAGSGEFEQVSVEETAILILSVINGIVRYRRTSQDPGKNLCKAAVDFCRRNLMNGNMKG
jgi:hypothetical protein